MRTTNIAWLFSAVAGLALSGCCTPAVIGSQAVTLSPQQQSNWCWAASGQMVMNFLGASVTQCDEANQEFGRSDCCDAPSSTSCDQPGWPQPDRYGFTFSTTSDAPLTWAQLQSQIYCSARPFAFSWHWPGGGGHMMVATGYATVEGTNYVSINDPDPVNQGNQTVVTYDWYNTAPGDHTHWNDYYNFVKTGGH